MAYETIVYEKKGRIGFITMKRLRIPVRPGPAPLSLARSSAASPNNSHRTLAKRLFS